MPSPHPLCNILYAGRAEKGECKVAGSSSTAFSCDALAFFLCNELGDKMRVPRVTCFIPVRAKVLTRFPHKAQADCGQKMGSHSSPTENSILLVSMPGIST